MPIPLREALDVQQNWATFKDWLLRLYDHTAEIVPGAVASAATATEQAGIAITKAGEAAASAALADSAGNATVAFNAAAAALTSKTAAEAARDAANAVGKVFTTTALGIAGTTSGQSFSVLSADLLDLIIYTNTAGTAVELLRFKTKVFMDGLGLFTNYTNRIGYAYAWLDESSNFALGITNAGRLILGLGGDIDQRIDTLEESSSTADTGYQRTGYAWAWLDSLGNLAGGIASDGSVISKGQNLTTRVEDQIISIATNTAAIALNTKWQMPVGFWWYGDSLSASGAPAWLASYLGKTVNVGAVGGQTAQQVAARFGGQIPMFTLAGNTIPASDAVAVTARTIDPITSQGGGPITGKLAGIAGTYTSDGSTHWTFTRATAGTAVVIDPATPFLIDITNDRLFGTVIFWYGRNNVGTGSFNVDVKQAIADSIAALKTTEKRFVVLSVLNWPGETTGTGNYNAVETLNAELKALYPNNFVEVLNLLRRSGNGSADDIADAASGLIPRSLRASSSDGHLNNTTGNPVVATRVFDFLTEKGWLA